MTHYLFSLGCRLILNHCYKDLYTMHLFKRLGCNTILPIVALLIGYFAFLAITGYLFVIIEEKSDDQMKNDRRLEFLRTLDKYNISYNNTMINEIITAAVNVFDVNGLDVTDYTKRVASEWNIGSSVFFAGTVVTTIGYGNITPKTTWGKAFCIILAIIGIPFTGVVLGKIGVAFTNVIKRADAFIENRIKQCFPKSSTDEKMKGHVRKIQLAFVFSFFIVFFLLIPAAIFAEFETDWAYFDSFYYCFISLSTIGLGDLTPGGSLKAIKFREGVSVASITNSLRQATVMLYLLFGLAGLSIILTIVSSILQSAAKKTLQGGTSLMNRGGRALKDVSGLELASETKRFASSIRKKTANTLGISISETTEQDDMSSDFGGRENDESKGEAEVIKNSLVEEERLTKDGGDDKHLEKIVIVTRNTNGYSQIENEDNMTSNDVKAKEFTVKPFSDQNNELKIPIADAC